ncbi:response regulator transcription factor [Chitinophaga arvensicola]|uniref:DNA-binding response regulator, OmpR family, contains REC and winged-helix (WHTH) domain n=1 Tax=Chitinophaga arvensicola TaxID=29529 RepID=A0A1I0RRK1_9BACT|nr:response regulator transcription factor [Chitinophaga arvensicola]SEW43849.1 DNA-binding response regulator, OmpR family, contains REC and winged-helix (wHTH) domain [Chitinophaga arvensicola]
MKLLIIEDEIQLAQSMISYLSGENYVCEYAGTYQQALTKIDMYEYECILLDIMLPGGDGMQLLEEIKKRQKEEGVIIISAKDSFDDKIQGLQLGADDYLSKPFHLPELAARIFSIIRRRKFNNSNIIRQNELTINLLAKTVLVHQQPVILTKKEFDLLLYFIGNRNKVVSKNALAEHLSGDIAGMLDDHNFIYAHIKNLKKKLHEAGCGNYLKTIYATGYKWEM